MSDNTQFPPLLDWEPTRETLHWYARAIGVIPRALAEFHPKWWHISLTVQPDGLATDGIGLPDGGTFRLKMDLQQHQVLLLVNDKVTREFSMVEGLSATAFGDQLLGAIADLGLTADYDRERFENDEPRPYNPDVVPAFWKALVNAARIFKEFRATLSGDPGPVQLWPHGFDVAFEWFGTRVVTYEEDGEKTEYPSQINLGFYPGDPVNAPYFYSNPWPFEAEQLLNQPLPEGASWHTEGWQGTILPYDEVAGDPNAGERVLEYARHVHELASPTLS